MVVESKAYRLWSRSTPIGSLRIERSRDADQDLRKVGKDPPVMRFVGVGQSRARHFAAKPHVVELAPIELQAGLDIAQTLAIGQLREGHREKLVPAGKVL